MKEMAISKFKAQCLAVLQEVKRTGQPLMVTRHGKPMAEIMPPPALNRGGSWIGCMEGQGFTVGDIISPLDPSDWGDLA
jgi:prevent-host-death family protein